VTCDTLESPDVGGNMPHSKFIVVVLPASLQFEFWCLIFGV